MSNRWRESGCPNARDEVEGQANCASVSASTESATIFLTSKLHKLHVEVVEVVFPFSQQSVSGRLAPLPLCAHYCAG